MIKENKAVYDYSADMLEDKWSGEKRLYKSSFNELPDYIKKNPEKYKEWMI